MSHRSKFDRNPIKIRSKFEQTSIIIQSRLDRNSIKNRQTAETAEPLFLLTGAVLCACSTFAMLAQRSTKIVRNWFNFCIVESHYIFIQNSFKIARQTIQNSIIFGFNLFRMRSKLVFLNSFKFRALKSTSLGAPWALPSRSQGTPRARRGRSRSSLRTLWTSRVPQEGPGSDFRSKFDQNSIIIGARLDQISTKH